MLARMVAAMVATGAATPPVTVEADQVRDWLGRPKVDDEVPERTDVPGGATGLAVTGAGGDVRFVETTAFPLPGEAGTGEPTLTLTGQLGDVMKESAQIALSYVRSHAIELGVDPDSLAKRVHVHVPAGAIPKDGPSRCRARCSRSVASSRRCWRPTVPDSPRWSCPCGTVPTSTTCRSGCER